MRRLAGWLAIAALLLSAWSCGCNRREIPSGPDADVAVDTGVDRVDPPVDPGEPDIAPVEDEEKYENCFFASYSLEAIFGAGVVVGGDTGNIELYLCERETDTESFLLIAKPEGIDDLLDNFDAYAAGLNPPSLADDPCNKQTYKALWREDMLKPIPAFRMCANAH